MKNAFLSQLLLSALLLVLCACAKSGQNSGLLFFDGKWGHLESLNQTNPSSIFLIHQNKDENYDICLPEYMISKYPGIKTELEASINLWAHYLGRKISVEFNVQPLPENTDKGLTSIQQIEQYYAVCGVNTDLVIGEAYTDGTTLGFTQQTYSYYVNSLNGKHDVASFKRGLFLRKSKEEDTKKYKWISFEKKSGKSYTSDELLKLMIERGTISFKQDDDTYTTLPIILHEIGHVWGLCDQYVIGEGGTNCDAKNATINEEGHVVLDFNAQMSSAGWKEKIYLAEDDITGIRKLGERFHNSHWPTKEEFQKIEIAPLKSKDIELFKINNAHYDTQENKFIVDLAMDTNAPIEFTIKIKLKNNERVISYYPVKINQPVSYGHYYMNLPLAKSEVEKVYVSYKKMDSEESIEVDFIPENEKEDVSTTDETVCENEVCSS
ncbi:MAG: hypothetical protein EP326_12265 [Deltaproteobacteria bacterium]|nr:MAG: hypothetical protein EP326_12265 [Deltaproteobacteria bacterium]